MTTAESSAQRCGQKAILLIDFQRDFLEADGRQTVGEQRSEVLIEKIRHLRTVARETEFIVIVNEFSPSDWLGNLIRNRSALQGTHGAEIDPRLDTVGLKIFSKSESDAFSNPALLDYLQDRGITRLSLTGVMTEGCVRATAVSAVQHGFETEVLADAVCSRWDWMHRLGLRLMRAAGVKISFSERFQASKVS